jgi:hypothetical protein
VKKIKPEKIRKKTGKTGCMGSKNRNLAATTKNIFAYRNGSEKLVAWDLKKK